MAMAIKHPELAETKLALEHQVVSNLRQPLIEGEKSYGEVTTDI